MAIINAPTSHCIVIVASLLFMVYATSDECKSTRTKRGLNLFNCSGLDFSQLPDDIPDEAEVLDFSRNKLMELPEIKESSLCTKDKCRSQNQDNHCRLDVSFSRNEIIDVPSHVLKHLLCLRTLDLSYNSISSTMLDIETFQSGFYGVESLILKGNPLTSLPDDVITPPFLHHLKYLDLSHCQLDEIGENSVDDLSELVTLDLSYNKLSELKRSTFKGLSSLRVLDLQHNNLETIDHDVFADLTNLDALQLSNNKIKSLASRAFDSDSTLKTIDLSNNKLNLVPYLALQTLPSLSRLILSYNPLLSLSGHSTSSILRKVTSLEIESTSLLSLDKGDLAAFPSIVRLSIRKNRNLAYIHSGFLSINTSNLQELHLEFNQLTTLSEEALPWKQLEELHLEGNPWRCDYRIRWMIHAKVVRPNSVICQEPPQLRGRDIKSLNPDHLQEPFPILNVIGIIVTFICLILMGTSAFFIWKRRRNLPCCREVKGRYVSVYTREDDGVENGEDRVSIQVEINRARLRTVSNGTSDDTMPFITVEKPSSAEDTHEL